MAVRKFIRTIKDGDGNLLIDARSFENVIQKALGKMNEKKKILFDKELTTDEEVFESIRNHH